MGTNVLSARCTFATTTQQRHRTPWTASLVSIGNAAHCSFRQCRSQGGSI